MYSTLTRTLCRVLIVLLAWTPFHAAQAGIISTEQAAAAAGTDRTAVLNFVQRTDVARQLQSLGVDAAKAQERIAAMTDEEVRSLAGLVHSAPAGGSWSAFTVLILIGVIVWIVYHTK